MPDFNYVDLSIFALLVLSAIIGMIRGLTREALGIAGWVGAFFATLYSIPYLRPHILPSIKNPFITDLLIATVVFLTTLVILNVISNKISLRVRGSILGGLDRSLGLFFGVLRGAVFMCIAFLLISIVWEPDSWSPPFKEAKSMPYISQGSHILRRLVPEDAVENLGFNIKSSSAYFNYQTPSADDLVMKLSHPEPAANTSDDYDGYGFDASGDMDRLTGSADD
ncbi:MAG: CvpA family protein [Alphaproteobacteria bacterium]